MYYITINSIYINLIAFLLIICPVRTSKIKIYLTCPQKFELYETGCFNTLHYINYNGSSAWFL